MYTQNIYVYIQQRVLDTCNNVPRGERGKSRFDPEVIERLQEGYGGTLRRILSITLIYCILDGFIIIIILLLSSLSFY